MNSMDNKTRRGISLMEVLASIFVMSVGLLGILAVIPFGNFQVSKAREAEYCANMLAAARNDIKVSGMMNPTNWTQGLSGNNIDCRLFFALDPLRNNDFGNPGQFYTQFSGNARFQELARGQDELEYTKHTKYRPDFTGQNGKAVSSGKYTWFATFSVTPKAGYTNIAAVESDYWPDKVVVDLLGCYNRIPGEERVIPDTAITFRDRYLNGVRLELRSNNKALLDFTGTKYVFVSWDGGGCWARIINSPADYYDDVNSEFVKEVVLMPQNGAFPSTLTNPQILIVPGVLYYTQQECTLK